MRNSLFETVATSLAALAIGVALAATPVLAAERHDGGGHHVAAVHRGGGGHGGARYVGHSHDGAVYENRGGCYDQGYYDQGCGRGPGIVEGIIGGAMGAVGGY